MKEKYYINEKTHLATEKIFVLHHSLKINKVVMGGGGGGGSRCFPSHHVENQLHNQCFLAFQLFNYPDRWSLHVRWTYKHTHTHTHTHNCCNSTWFIWATSSPTHFFVISGKRKNFLKIALGKKPKAISLKLLRG